MKVIGPTNLKEAAVFWRAQLLDPSDLVLLAEEAVVEGCDEDIVVEVAGMPRAGAIDTWVLMSRLSEAGVVVIPPNRDNAMDALVDLALFRIATGTVDPIQGVRFISLLRHESGGLADKAYSFLGMLDEYEEGGEHQKKEVQAEILEAARAAANSR